jgi:hypothetical protein
MKAIAMKATQEDWESVKDLVLKVEDFDNISDYTYLVTNYNGELGIVSNIHWRDYAKCFGRTFHETFDRSIFLDALDIVEEKILDRNNLEIKYAGCDDWHEYSGSSQFRLKPINPKVKQLQELADKLGYKIEKL